MANQANTCPVCFSRADLDRDTRGRDIFHVNCPRCGSFIISRTADVVFRQEVDESETGRSRFGTQGSRKRANASAWIRENKPYRLDSRQGDRLAGLSTPTVTERFQKLMLLWADRTEFVGERLNPLEHGNASEWIARTWSLNQRELQGLIQMAAERDYLKGKIDGSTHQFFPPGYLSPAGWEFIEALQRPDRDNPQCFVAMWFHSSMDEVYEKGIAPAIAAAGYRPHRVDQREFAGRIDDEIIAQIRRSRFIVADLTRARPSVYYEAGWGHGLGLEVLFTAKKRTKLHFDIRQHNTIFWKPDRLETFRSALRARIEAVLGKGPLPTPSEES